MNARGKAMRRHHVALPAAIVLALAVGAVTLWQCTAAHPGSRATLLTSRLAERVRVDGHAALDCRQLAEQRPLVLLALGQSNAGNHGQAAAPARPAIAMSVDGQCVRARDPLPGATGRGGSIWSRLPAALAQAGLERPVVLSVLAVDATLIDDWVRPHGPLPAALESASRDLERAGLHADFVLWQQGEADARAATPAPDYAQALLALAATLRRHGVDAPVLVARSTVCRAAPAATLHRAQDHAAAQDSGLRIGPDTDTALGRDERIDGCHFSAPGLDAAARLWAQRILSETPRNGTHPKAS